MRSFLTENLKVFNLRQNFNNINQSLKYILHSCNMSGTPIKWRLRDILKKKKKSC